MKSVLLVTPVFHRYELTRLMLLKRVETFAEVAARSDVKIGCVVIGNDKNLHVAEECGFHVIEAPNILGRKYNDGHQFAVENGWDYSFQVNSDQVFDPRLLMAIADSPNDSLIRTTWATFVHGTGKMALTFQNPVWAMKAYPRVLLEKNPRPCDEDLMSMCDTSVHNGVMEAHGGELETHTIEVGPLETIQFESGFQVTPWRKNIKVAAWSGVTEHPVPWHGVAELHGESFLQSIQEFYGL